MHLRRLEQRKRLTGAAGAIHERRPRGNADRSEGRTSCSIAWRSTSWSENWLVYRDAQDWDNFYNVHHDDCFLMTTWGGKATPREFAAAASKGYAQGDRMLHSLGSVAVQINGDRAISQAKFRIMQRGPVEGVLCDLTCIGRNYDFCEKRDGGWGFVARQPIYERDSIVTVDPSETVKLDPEKLARFPEGYARLGLSSGRPRWDDHHRHASARGAEGRGALRRRQAVARGRPAGLAVTPSTVIRAGRWSEASLQASVAGLPDDGS